MKNILILVKPVAGMANLVEARYVYGSIENPKHIRIANARPT
jgi:hypothetical protein